MFTKAWKYDAIKSVEEEDLYAVFTYLSWESADIEYNSQYQKLAQKRAKGGMNY